MRGKSHIVTRCVRGGDANYGGPNPYCQAVILQIRALWCRPTQRSEDPGHKLLLVGIPNCCSEIGRVFPEARCVLLSAVQLPLGRVARSSPSEAVDGRNLYLRQCWPTRDRNLVCQESMRNDSVVFLQRNLVQRRPAFVPVVEGELPLAALIDGSEQVTSTGLGNF